MREDVPDDDEEDDDVPASCEVCVSVFTVDTSPESTVEEMFTFQRAEKMTNCPSDPNCGDDFHSDSFDC